MKTQKEINQAFKKLVTVDLENYADNATPWNIYWEEYGAYSKLPIVEGVKQWMLGLPSCLTMPFTYHEIGEWLESITGKPDGWKIDWYDHDTQLKRYWWKAADTFVKLYQPK